MASLVQTRIARALAARQRYTYVQPRVVARGVLAGGGQGWCILSPNCSRNIDAAGGEIAIAWFEPPPAADAGQGWRLHAFDHTRQQWADPARGLSLDRALALVLQDPHRRYWP